MSKLLKDIQNLEDKRGIDIQKVGIKAVEVPLLIQRKDEIKTPSSPQYEKTMRQIITPESIKMHLFAKRK
mgnify:CR=1 FL=1